MPEEPLPIVYDYNGVRLGAAPEEYDTPQKAKNYYATKYAELATATIEGPTIVDGYQVYSLRKPLTTKG